MRFAKNTQRDTSKVLRLPRKMTMDTPKVLRLPRKLQHIFWKRRKSIAPATQNDFRHVAEHVWMSRSATPATRNEATTRLKPPKITTSAELPIGTAIRGSRERLRTVALANATSSEHTLNPQTPRVKREPLLRIREKDSQTWGYRMRLLSSIFPQHSLSYKMPLRFNNLDIGGGFPLLQNAPSFSTTVSYKDIPFDKPAWSSSCHATKCHCDFHDGLTWLKWFLYKMRFTSLSYKILDLDFISGLAWLK